MEVMHDGMSRDPALMRLRRSTVEHPFDRDKARMGASHFLNRWLGYVRTETAFHVLAYRLKRGIALIGLRDFCPAFLPEKRRSAHIAGR